MLETLKKNIKNKMWWVAIISAVVVLGQSFGLDLTKYIGIDWQTRLNTIFSILVLLGISVDTIANVTSVAQDSTENTIQADLNNTNTNVTDNSNSNNDKDAVALNSTIIPKAPMADNSDINAQEV